VIKPERSISNSKSVEWAKGYAKEIMKSKSYSKN
jgi:hypothetical protein